MLSVTERLERSIGMVLGKESTFRNNRLAVFGATSVLVVALVAIFVPLVIPYSVNTTIDYGQKFLGPSLAHPLGTDNMGRDLLRVLLWGTNTDMYAITLISLGSLAIGIPLGTLAGFRGGIVDNALMRFTDIFLAFPRIILAMAVTAVLGHSILNLTLSLLIVWWPSIARIIRGQVLVEKQKLYIDSLRSMGARKLRIMMLHLIPNTLGPVIVQITLQVGWIILDFAGLNFLGFGTGSFTPEWGQIISNGETYVFTSPYMIVFAGLAILFTSLAFNFLGDGLRDVIDPRNRA